MTIHSKSEFGHVVIAIQVGQMHTSREREEKY